MSSTLRLRLLAACLAGGTLLTACSSGGGAASGDASEVNAALTTVADARAAAASQVDAELRAGLRVEPMATALRSPDEVDATLEEVPAVMGMLDAVAPTAVAGALDELDAALEAAAVTISQTRAGVDEGSWQAEFLGAQRDVLDALAVWSLTSRDLHRVAAEHTELWRRVVDAASVLRDERTRYRSPDEAAGTWEIEVADDLQALAEATAALTTEAGRRDEAASLIDAADERAAEVFERRPASSGS